MTSKDRQQKLPSQLTQAETGNGGALLWLLNERETARRLSVSPAALCYWRAHGGGPPWIRIGERLIRYDLTTLRKWVEERAQRSND